MQNIDFAKILPMLIPILIIQFGLQVFAIVDLVRRPAEQVRWAKWIWALIIVLGELLGPIVYFMLGRREE
jgi:4-amino-4-deoxy-L-arabinose transferase-like glycosyltransferase